MQRPVAVGILALSVASAACESFGQAMTAHTDVVARAAGHELTIDEATSLLAKNPRLPAQAEVVEALANLWVDYILLATAVAEDSQLQNIKLDPLVEPFLEQKIVWQLRDKVIQVDTALSDEELRVLYEQEKPGRQVRARHILLRLPADATPAQRDSVLALANDLRTRAAAGGDFGALAREHSQDPGSAEKGGDLGFFGAGQMVAPFEEAAFALGVGQVSNVVETPFGLHIIKVEEQKLPAFEDIKASFREESKVKIQLDAEEQYLKGLTQQREIKVEENAFDVARELAGKPTTELGGRAANRALVDYKGGAFTAGEFLELMRRFQPNQRARYAAASDQELEQVLKGLTQNELLIEEARKQGLKAEPIDRDTLAMQARLQLISAAGIAGIKGVTPQQGETREQAIKRAVNTLLEKIVQGEQNVLPLGPISFSLREQYGAQVFERAYPAVVAKVEASRPASPMTPTPLTPPTATPQPSPQDTATRRQ